MEREYQIAADTTLDNKIKLNDIIKSFQYIKGTQLNPLDLKLISR